MVSEDDVRRVALSLPGAIEEPYHRLPGFRVRRNLFTRVHEQPDAIFVRCVDIAERDGLLSSEPAKFFITEHSSGSIAAASATGRGSRRRSMRKPAATISSHVTSSGASQYRTDQPLLQVS